MAKIRLKAILLCLFIVLNICTSAVRATPGELLSQLNIMDKVGDGRVVSKGEFSCGIVNLIGAQLYDEEETLFDDLDKNGKYYKEVSALARLGILSGDENKMINADMPLTFNQAVKMIMCALGYEDYAKLYGNYPNGYIQAARKVNLFKNLSMRGENWLEESEAERLLYNALYAPMLDISAISTSGDVKYDNSNNDNLPLYVYRGLRNGKGIVTAVPYYEKLVSFSLAEDRICVDGKQYIYAAQNESLMGKQVEFFYDDNDNIAALAVTDKNSSTEFLFDDIASFEGNVISYYDTNAKKRQLTINVGSEIIYNCETLTGALRLDFENEDGIVRAVSNDGDSIYDYIFVDCYRDFIVGSVDRINNVIYDKNDAHSRIDLSETSGKSVKITNEYGENVSIDDIETGMLITAIEGVASTRICLCEGEITGRITQTNGTDKISVNDREYVKSRYFERNYTAGNGAYGRFLINNYGEISAYEPANNDKKFGYLIKAGKEGSIAPTYKYKILDENGKILVLNSSDKLEYNCTKGQTAKAVYDAVCAETPSTRQLIRYGVNSDGEMNVLETAADETEISEERLKLVSTLNNSIYISSSGIYGGKLVITANTLLFCIPNTETDCKESDYKVTNATSYLKSSNKYSMKAYCVGNNKVEIDALILSRSYDSAGMSDTSPVGVFDKILHTIDKNGIETEQMVLFTEDGKKTFLMRRPEQLNQITDSNGNPYTLKRGDLVRYSYDSISDEIRTFALLYSREQDKIYGSVKINDWNSSFHYNFGYAYKKMNDYVFISTQSPVSGLGISDLNLYKVSNLIVYDEVNNELINGSMSDIADYTSTERKTRVFVQTSSSAPKLMYIVYE